jgi:hypothetical protein
MDTLHTLYKTPLHKRITKDSPCAVGDRKRGRGRAVRLRRAPLDRLVRGEPWATPQRFPLDRGEPWESHKKPQNTFAISIFSFPHFHFQIISRIYFSDTIPFRFPFHDFTISHFIKKIHTVSFL